MMFRIGEFSRLTQVSVRMLRYYDEAGLLKPARTDPFTGYRLYAAEQIPVLRKILYLRDCGFQVAQIAAALEGKDTERLFEQLEEKRKEIELTILEEENKLKRIRLAQQELQNGGTDMHYQVFLKSVPACRVLSLRRVIPDYYEEGKLWQELSSFAAENQVPVSGHTFSVYHDAEYKEQEVDVEVCMPVEVLGESRNGFTYRIAEAVPEMACTMVYGPFSNIAGAYLAFAGWLDRNRQYRMLQGERQIVHRGPWNEKDPDLFLTEIQIPLRTE